MKYITSAISALMIVGCQAAPVVPEAVAPAMATAAPEATQNVQVADAEDDISCRSMKETGTRFIKRECKTITAWKQYDAYTKQNAKEATDGFQRLRSGCSTQAQGTC
ncbi:hypothetical protein [Hyphomonas sp.]|uniref:hypothetical protein n=1 Tax=Hyphomonas sp. TaxID=87 RepID=UPI0030F59230